MHEWRSREDPRKPNGEPYKTDSATLLSNATVRSPDAPPTRNRNARFLRRKRGANGEWVYALDPTRIW